MTLTFDNPAGILWLVAAAAVTALGVGAALWRRRAAARFADAALLPRIAPGLSLACGLWRAALLGGAAVCLAVALMDPRAAEQTEEVTRRGADVMFVVDVSRSMLAEDATPNRLERARTFISDAIDSMGGDRAGLIDFAGVAAVRTPLTLNYDALKAAVDGLEPKDSRRGGSMLGDAIRLAAESFPTDDAGHAIVILSDGEDMGSDPVDAAKEAAERGIRIITVGIGDAREGARIPVGDGQTRRFLVHDGEEVWSRMDAATLRDVAGATGGLYVPAGTAQVELGEILSRSLSDLERTEGDASVAKTAAPLFQWPAGLALALLVIESLVSARARQVAAVASGSTSPSSPQGAPSSQPAPGRRRRARQRSAAATAAIAALAALAGVAGPTATVGADDSASSVRAPQPRLRSPAAKDVSAASASSDAPAQEDPGDAPAATPRVKRNRPVGRGQIDRAAFRDAIGRANAAMKSGQYAEAAAEFAAAMDADPTSAAAAYNRGVAEYRAGMLDEAAGSFAEAASRGDAALAADAMFNQGNAIYSSALRALEGDASTADPSAADQAPAVAPAQQPDLAAAAEAVSQALTHYKDAIAANPSDVDSRANAELAHTLLKQLREMQQQQQQQQQNDQDNKDQQEKDDQQQDRDQQEQDKQDTQEQQENGGECDNPQPGDGQQGSEGKTRDQQGSSGTQSEAKQPESEPKDPADAKDPDRPEGEDGKDKTDEKKPGGSGESNEQSASERADEPKADEPKADGSKADEPSDTSDKDGREKPAPDSEENAKPEGELKERNGSGKPAQQQQQQPPASTQARAGEPVPGAPLTKSEAERLLQGVRDRAKQRMEAKERAERVRQVPAVRDW